MDSIRQVGFIGLGNMGGRIARQIVNAGYEVIGFDINQQHVENAGVIAAKSVADVLRNASIILLSLPDSKVVESVCIGLDNGVLSHATNDHIIIDLSTSNPTTSIRLAEKLSVVGAQFLDVGISGGAKAAEIGELTLMIGGDKNTVERCSELFSSFSKQAIHLGASGAGHTAKLLNNFLNATTLAATSEVMIAGKKAGIDLKVLLQVINNSSGQSFASTNRFPHIIDGDYLEGGLTSSLMMKDVKEYVTLLSDLGISSLNAAGPMASFGLAIGTGYGNEISNRVVDAIGDVSGGVRLSKASLNEEEK